MSIAIPAGILNFALVFGTLTRPYRPDVSCTRHSTTDLYKSGNVYFDLYCLLIIDCCLLITHNVISHETQYYFNHVYKHALLRRPVEYLRIRIPLANQPTSAYCTQISKGGTNNMNHIVCGA